MFQTNILNFASRVDVARHGFESVTLKLAKDYDEIREVCRRHGIEISATRVRKVVRHFSAEREKTRAWRRILEQTTGALLRQSGGDLGRTRARRSPPAYISLTTLRLTFSVGVSSPGLLGEVVVEEEELLDLLDARVVLVDAVELALDELDDLRLRVQGSSVRSGGDLGEQGRCASGASSVRWRGGDYALVRGCCDARRAARAAERDTRGDAARWCAATIELRCAAK